MRKNRKRIAVLSMAAVMALGMSVTALAKDNTKEVKGRLEIRFDGEEPEAGDTMDIPGYTVSHYPEGVRHEVTDEYFDNEEDEFQRGTEPVICLALMGCGGPCLPLDWERLGAFSITLW